jgi:hypothetical protein
MSNSALKKRSTVKPKQPWRFRGICADAAALGVSRSTLYRLLTGERKSKRLAAHYAELKAQQDSKPRSSAAQ